MRQFKFRIWNKVKKHWTQYGFDILGEISIMGYIGYDGHDNKSIPLLELNDLVVNQFTGLIDIIGKDVYEGDIICYDTSKIGGEVIIGEVEWINDLTLSPMIGFGIWGINKQGWQPLGIGEYTVLGNIYETPEILKGDNK